MSDLPSRRRLVIITTVHGPFDVRVFHRQARSLAAAGYDTYLLARHSRDEDRDGVRVRALPNLRRRLLRPLLWPVAFVKALRLRADAYHVHDPELLPLAWALQTVSRRPAVYDSHEYVRESVRARPWIPAPLRPPAAAAAGWLEKALARRLAAVVVVNRHMAEGFAGTNRVVVAHNFPLLEHFRSLEGPRPEAEAAVIYAGGQSKQRGLELMFRAAPRVRSAAPGARVMVLGPVDWEGIDPRYRAPTEDIELLGTVRQEEVPAHLARAAVGWIPWLETPNNVRGLPNKLFEYMAAGLPVLAPEFGPMAEVVRQEGCGLLARPGDAADHASKILYLLQHPEEAAAMGERGRRAVRERYNWEAERGGLLALYEELLGPAGG